MCSTSEKQRLCCSCLSNEVHGVCTRGTEIVRVREGRRLCVYARDGDCACTRGTEIVRVREGRRL